MPTNESLTSRFPEIEPASIPTIAKNWQDTEPYLWIETDVYKNPNQLRSLLEKAYHSYDEVSEIQSLRISLSEPVQSEFKAVELNLLMAAENAYDKKKSTEDFNIWESVGFVVFENSKSELCSLPVMGSSGFGTHYLIVGSADFYEKEFIYSKNFSKNGEKVLTIQSPLTPIQIVLNDSLSSLCTWKSRAFKKDSISKAMPSKIRFVFDFETALITDPLDENQVSALVLQSPAVRRGYSVDCELPEEQRWLLFGKKLNGKYKLFGGRFNLEDVEHEKVVWSANRGAILDWDSLDSESNPLTIPFEIYLARAPDKKKTIFLKPTKFDISSEEKIKILLEEIPRAYSSN
ncbi:MAG: hypothetical protein J0L93_06365 [Deltaproteobacteria bacterium]|nr:hypothetical protein [Deltaproteobacteria bacterium]